jgi:hypothetical protein
LEASTTAPKGVFSKQAFQHLGSREISIPGGVAVSQVASPQPAFAGHAGQIPG